MSSRCVLLGCLLLLAGCGAVMTPGNAIAPSVEKADTTAVQQGLEQGRLVSAFFGLDNKLPLLASWRICPGAGSADGMPVIFDREVDVTSVQAGDFVVVTRGGKAGSVVCVTMMPAADEGELRTALLVGEFGSAKDDPPAEVVIAGHVLSKDGKADYKGARLKVTPLEAGPEMVLAEVVALDTVKDRTGSWAQGSGCPSRTTQAVRVVWAGGVRLRDGDELGEVERRLYKVELEDGQKVIPFALGDLDDGDNNHLLCLNVGGTPTRVWFPAGPLADPNRDPNPATTVLVTTSSGRPQPNGPGALTPQTPGR